MLRIIGALLSVLGWNRAGVASVKTESVVRSIISLRRQMAENPNLTRMLLREYYKFFCRAFPFKNEREEIEVYDQYLNDPDFPWDCLVLMENAQIIGGCQFQHLSVGSDAVLFAEHFWLRSEYRSNDRFLFLGREVERNARDAGAVAIVWECNDPRQMSDWQKRIDRKAGLSTEKRNRLWSRYGRVLDVYYAQPRLSPEESPVEFLMLCIRPIRKEFVVTGLFYRTLFRNFVLTFNDSPENDETYRKVVEYSLEYEDEAPIQTVSFNEPRSFLLQKREVA